MRLFPFTLLLTTCSFAATLHNSDVRHLVRDGTSVSEIVAKINTSESGFQLFPEDVQSLEKYGVPATVIQAMFARNANSRLMVGDITDQEQPNSTSVPPRLYPTADINSAAQVTPQHSQSPQSIASVRLRNAVFFPDQGGGGGTREELIVPETTQFRLRFSQNLSSGHARTGDQISFYVLSDVYVKNGVGNFLVIKRGAHARGTITDAFRKRMMGRPGRVEVTLDSVDLANGDKIAISYQRQGETGDNHVARMAAFMATTVFVVPPATPFWLFLHGGDAGIKDAVDFSAETIGVANLDSREFPQR